VAIKITVDDTKGLIQKTATSGGAVGIKQARSASGTFVAATATIVSEKITIPANSLITAYHVVATSELTRGGAANLGAKFGVVGNDDSLVALDADSIHAAGDGVASLPVGEGNSSDTNVSAALDDAGGHNTPLAAVIGAQKVGASDIEVIGTIVSNAENFTAGTAQFIVEFVTFS